MPSLKPKRECEETEEFGSSLTQIFLVRPQEPPKGKKDEPKLDPSG